MLRVNPVIGSVYRTVSPNVFDKALEFANYISHAKLLKFRGSVCQHLVNFYPKFVLNFVDGRLQFCKLK